MLRPLSQLLLPALVTAIDLVWGMTLSALAKPWLLQMLRHSEQQATRFVARVMEPRLWVGYAIVLAAQLIWVTVVAPRDIPEQRRRQLWWMGGLIVVVSSAVIQQDLALPAGPGWLLLGVQIGDFLLLYWLATRLLTPLPQRRVIPGWW
jgi:hypothetical protein